MDKTDPVMVERNRCIFIVNKILGDAVNDNKRAWNSVLATADKLTDSLSTGFTYGQMAAAEMILTKIMSGEDILAAQNT